MDLSVDDYESSFEYIAWSLHRFHLGENDELRLVDNVHNLFDRKLRFD
ncbi:MAG: hypothetical protein OXU23_03340 [Candidatus Poribacteria bacterium]|nr:hypothetical protein [Candidatus Poribacteria bacterium]